MSYNPNKVDPILGQKVHEHLVSLGLETPTIKSAFKDFQEIDSDTKIEIIKNHFEGIMQTLGLDLEDDSLMDTPRRVAKMYVNEIFWGLDWEKFPKCTKIENKMGYNEMVIERGINVQSNCEHHFVIIDGLATVAYIPNKTVLGLSKMNRIVEYFAKRPQVQERLTEQVFHAISFILETDNVAVLIDAKHYCVASRGVEDAGSQTTTSKLGGAFKNDPVTRSEFMAIANK